MKKDMILAAAVAASPGAAGAPQNDGACAEGFSAAVKARAREFIENQRSFRLGFLPTERSNPITASLERDFKRSFIDGVECLQRADRQVPIAMRHVVVSPEYRALVDAMESALRSEKGRIVFTGCGATGRLSILLESMWRDFFSRRSAELSPDELRLADRVQSIMTAGDYALIKSVEFFEDYTEGGARQTDALGIGLVDEIGTIEDAIAYAAIAGGDADLKAWNVVEYPAPQTITDIIMGMTGQNTEDFSVYAKWMSDWKNGKREFTFASMPYKIEVR